MSKSIDPSRYVDCSAWDTRERYTEVDPPRHSILGHGCASRNKFGLPEKPTHAAGKTVQAASPEAGGIPVSHGSPPKINVKNSIAACTVTSTCAASYAVPVAKKSSYLESSPFAKRRYDFKNDKHSSFGEAQSGTKLDSPAGSNGHSRVYLEARHKKAVLKLEKEGDSAASPVRK